MSEKILEISNIKILRGKHPTLQIDRLSIARGEMVAVVGPNGAGKSTFLQFVNMHLTSKEGSAYLFGEDISKADKQSLRRRSSMVFQEALLLDETVLENVALPLKFRGVASGDIKQKVSAALSAFHCDHLMDRRARNLSGGEVQRVCLARAMVSEPELLLLDEPFAALDLLTRNKLLANLKCEAIARATTVVLVSHNFRDVLYFAERAIVLQAGYVVQDDKPEVILRYPENEVVACLVEMDNVLPCIIEREADKVFIKLSNGIRFAWRGKYRCDINLFCCLPGDALSIVNEQSEEKYKITANTQDEMVVMQGVIVQIVPGIGVYNVVTDAQGLILTARVPRQVTEVLFLGALVKVVFAANEAHITYNHFS